MDFASLRARDLPNCIQTLEVLFLYRVDAEVYLIERGRKQQDILLKREMDLSGWGRLESLFGREAGDELRYECRREHHEI